MTQAPVPTPPEPQAPVTEGVTTTVGAVGQGTGNLNVQPSLVINQLFRDAEVPVFSGKPEHFQQWNWEFEDKCRLLSQGQ